MSKEQLVEAYLDGAITRRVFIRRLVAAGVSLSAALVYADSLRAHEGHHPPTFRDFYDHYRAGTRHGHSGNRRSSPRHSHPGPHRRPGRPPLFDFFRRP